MTKAVELMYLVFLIFLTNNQVLVSGDDIREKIDKVVESIREAIPENIALEYVVDHTIPDDSLHSGTIKVKNVEITGVKDFDFQMNYVWMVTYIPRSFVLTLENVGITAVYDCNINIFKSRFFRFWGAGNIKYNLKNLILVGNISVTGGVISKEPLQKISISIEETTANLNNLLEHEEFSTMVTDFINNYLNMAEILKDNEEVVGNFLKDVGNKIIQSITSKGDNEIPNQNNYVTNGLKIFKEMLNDSFSSESSIMNVIN